MQLRPCSAPPPPPINLKTSLSNNQYLMPSNPHFNTRTPKSRLVLFFMLDPKPRLKQLFQLDKSSFQVRLKLKLIKLCHKKEDILLVETGKIDFHLLSTKLIFESQTSRESQKYQIFKKNFYINFTYFTYFHLF